MHGIANMERCREAWLNVQLSLSKPAEQNTINSTATNLNLRPPRSDRCDKLIPHGFAVPGRVLRDRANDRVNSVNDDSRILADVRDRHIDPEHEADERGPDDQEAKV